MPHWTTIAQILNPIVGVAIFYYSLIYQPPKPPVKKSQAIEFVQLA